MNADLAGLPSLGERLLCAGVDASRKTLGRLPPWEQRLVANSWYFCARPAQLPPPGDWQTWLVMAGRGFGKTRAGAEWTHDQALENPDARIAIIGMTQYEARSVMVEGETGLLRCGNRNTRPRFEPSNRRLVWPNGAMAFLYSADGSNARTTDHLR